MDFPDRLKNARNDKGLSGAALGRELGGEVSRQLVNHWEKGRHVPNLTQVQQLCRVLNVTASWLVLGQGREEFSPDAIKFATKFDSLSPDEQKRYAAGMTILRPEGSEFTYKESPKDREKQTRTPGKREK